MRIRPVRPEECARLGALTLAAYTALDGHVAEPDYEAELADVRTRAEAPATEVLVAVDDDGTLLGGVTFVEGPASPFYEHDDEGWAAIRMLAVEPAAGGRGVGTALVGACIDRARALGVRGVALHSTPWMERAHRIYERLGFVRAPEHDWAPSPAVPLLAYRLALPPP